MTLNRVARGGVVIWWKGGFIVINFIFCTIHFCGVFSAFSTINTGPITFTSIFLESVYWIVTFAILAFWSFQSSSFFHCFFRFPPISFFSKYIFGASSQRFLVPKKGQNTPKTPSGAPAAWINALIRAGFQKSCFLVWKSAWSGQAQCKDLEAKI